MSNELIDTVQKQDSGSELIMLYVLEYQDGQYAYFTNGLEDGTSVVQFRDSESPYTIRDYVALPINADGFEVASDGAYSRPTLSVANIASVFSDEIGGLDFEELTGSRLTRRLTLKKYLVGEPGDASPPVEYPKTTYILDRLIDKNVIQVTFELAAPFDLAGITLPARQVIGGSCPWQYQGASADVAKEDKVGGCVWNNTVSSGGTQHTIYANKDDEYIVPNSITFTTFSSSATEGSYYTTTGTRTKVLNDGSLSDSTVTNYWQAMRATTVAPSDNSADWRRVRVYSTYSAGASYEAFTDSKYNSYVLYNGNIYQLTYISTTGVAPGTKYWKRAESCGKRIGSCAMRFQANPDGSGGVSVNQNQYVSLPYGGFPGSRQFR